MEYKIEKNTKSQQHKAKRFKKNKDGLRDLWDNMKHNIHTIGIPEGEESEQGLENLFVKTITEYFPNQVKEKVIQVQEA